MKNLIISAFLSLAAVGCGPASRGTDESGQQALAAAREEAAKAEARKKADDERKKEEAACLTDPNCTRPGLKTPTEFVGTAPEMPDTPTTKEKEGGDTSE